VPQHGTGCGQENNAWSRTLNGSSLSAFTPTYMTTGGVLAHYAIFGMGIKSPAAAAAAKGVPVVY
jgi:hypothetical protein